MGRRSRAEIEAARAAFAAPAPDQEEKQLSETIEESPEFQAAVAKGIEKASDAIRDQILAQMKQAGSLGGDNQAFAEMIAMATAQLADQGTGRKHVSPEILRQRAEARTLMAELLVQARLKKEKPTYQLRNKVYFDEQLIEPIWIAPDHTQRATEIEWYGPPNEALIPLNHAAKAIFKAYMDSIGSIENAPSERPLAGVTAGGLVIKSGSQAVRPVTALGDRQGAEPHGEGLSVVHRNKPGQYVEKHILGTVAPPARQTA